MISSVDKLENILCSFLNISSEHELMNALVNEYYDLLNVWSEETNLSIDSLVDCIEYYLNKDVTWYSDTSLCKIQLDNNISFSFEWFVDTAV